MKVARFIDIELEALGTKISSADCHSGLLGHLPLWLIHWMVYIYKYIFVYHATEVLNYIIIRVSC